MSLVKQSLVDELCHICLKQCADCEYNSKGLPYCGDCSFTLCELCMVNSAYELVHAHCNDYAVCKSCHIYLRDVA